MSESIGKNPTGFLAGPVTEEASIKARMRMKGGEFKPDVEPRLTIIHDSAREHCKLNQRGALREGCTT